MNIKDSKSFSVPLAKRFEITFKKTFGKFKKGDKTSVTLPVAIKWVNLVLVEKTSAITAAIAEAKAEPIINNPVKDKKTKDKTIE
jgi:hypothetical protein